MKSVVWTVHATTACAERGLDPEWILQTVHFPDWVQADIKTAGAERRYRAISPAGDRTLRVVCFETEAEIRVLTAFLDRRARRPG